MKLGLEGVGGDDMDPTDDVRGGGTMERVAEDRFDLVELDDPRRLLPSLSAPLPSLLAPGEVSATFPDLFFPLSFPSRDFPSERDPDAEVEVEGSEG